MSLTVPFEILPRTGSLNVAPVPPVPDADRKGLSKKEVAADHPTWCPGCGDFSVLALYYKLIEKRKMLHSRIREKGLIDQIDPTFDVWWTRSPREHYRAV